MKVIIVIIVVLAVVILVYAIFDYIYKFGSLEGEIVFDGAKINSENFADSMYVFLISAEIGPFLDSLNVFYDKNIAALEDTVSYFRDQLNELIVQVREEEVLFHLMYGGQVLQTEKYRENKIYIDKMKADRDSIGALHSKKRDRLIERQNGYNGVINTLIKDKMFLKAEIDEKGRFLFPKVPNDDYFIYAFRVISGDEDITNIPTEMYYIYALSGEDMHRYSWMFKVTIDEDTYIRLDRSNMSQVYK